MLGDILFALSVPVRDLRPKALWRLETDIEPLGNADTAAPRSLGRAVYKGGRKLLREALRGRGWRRFSVPAGARNATTLTYAATLNQKRAAMRLVSLLTGVFFIVRGLTPPAHDSVAATAVHARARSAFLSLPLLPAVVFIVLRASREERELSRNSFDATLRGYGDVLFWLRLLRRTQPRTVLVLNDHSADHRALVLAARRLAIPSFFLPHGPTAEHFPGLMTNFAFLDGTAVADMYAGKRASATTAFLTGPVRFPVRGPAVSEPHRPFDGLQLGVAVTLLDPDERVVGLLEALKRGTPHEVTVRPHPRTGKKRLAGLRRSVESLGYGFSDANEESAEQFLSGLQILMSGTSGILLEAAIRGVAPVYYDFPRNGLDYYGFISRRLVDRRCVKPDDALEEIENRRTEGQEGLLARVKPFCEDLSTPYEGASPELARDILVAVSAGRRTPTEPWRTLSGYEPLTVYGLKDDQ